MEAIILKSLLAVAGVASLAGLGLLVAKMLGPQLVDAANAAAMSDPKLKAFILANRPLIETILDEIDAESKKDMDADAAPANPPVVPPAA